MKSKQHTQGAIYMVLGALMFGSYGVWSRLLGKFGFGVFFQSWSHSLLIFVILLPILIYRKEIVRIRRKDWKWLIWFLIFTSATQAPIYYAFNHMDIGTASLLFFVTMLITMYIVGFLFLKESASWVKGVSFVLACVGLYLVFSFSIEKFTLLAALAAVLNGFASGSEVSFSKKLSHRYSPLYITGMSWAVVFLTNLVVSLALHESQLVPSWDIVWFYWVCYSLAGLFGFTLMVAGLKYLEASIGGLLGLLEIIFSIAFGALFFGEMLTGRMMVGALVILGAAALPHLVEFNWVKRQLRAIS